jgi:sulfite reductase alpha subunit
VTEEKAPDKDTQAEVERGAKILKELEKGEWPSYVTETKKTRYPVKAYGVSLSLRRNLWGVGGYVSVPGIPTGILMRITTRPDIGESANLLRVYVPSGYFLPPKLLKLLADCADKYGVGMIHGLTTSSDIEIPGVPKERLLDLVKELREGGMDVGSTGDSFRNTTACVGPALCEFANYDSLKIRDDFYDKFMDYAKYPTFPHKMKVKLSACPLDCTRSSQKADIAVIGTWDGAPDIDSKEVAHLASKDVNAPARISETCPTRAIRVRGSSLDVVSEDCVQCMECIKAFPGTLLPGRKKKFKILVGGKLRGKKGPLTAKVLTYLDSEEQVFACIEKIVSVYTDTAARKERLGDLISRIGMKEFLNLMNEKVDPKQVKELRTNVFYQITDEARDVLVKDLRDRMGGKTDG